VRPLPTAAASTAAACDRDGILHVGKCATTIPTFLPWVSVWKLYVGAAPPAHDWRRRAGLLSALSMSARYLASASLTTSPVERSVCAAYTRSQRHMSSVSLTDRGTVGSVSSAMPTSLSAHCPTAWEV
jgi:hypothetical protein